jgi:hypothetical protein
MILRSAVTAALKRGLVYPVESLPLVGTGGLQVGGLGLFGTRKVRQQDIDALM